MAPLTIYSSPQFCPAHRLPNRIPLNLRHLVELRRHFFCITVSHSTLPPLILWLSLPISFERRHSATWDATDRFVTQPSKKTRTDEKDTPAIGAQRRTLSSAYLHMTGPCTRSVRLTGSEDSRVEFTHCRLQSALRYPPSRVLSRNPARA